ncbi:DUF3576 domain-containing protein [Phaeovulum sp.]|uniref:DUF3576 domain-containing protein n=1 Tax=Phaeovulum sp. TaxID=2934796 RepID=UPI003568BBE0
MTITRILRAALLAGLAASVAACGTSSGNLFGSRSGSATPVDTSAPKMRDDIDQSGGTIWDLFKNADDPNITVEVNKYLWQASLEVLNFLPIQSVDPFSGIIVTGYGTPPGGGRSYRATIYVTDPALDARSLKVSLQGSGGAAVSSDTVHAVEDAILTRARQLRIRDSGL